MKIHVLDSSVASLIAAGEVVERPASVVKELVENSVDAGATSIGVDIIDGGIKQIKITDNGCGMTEEDAKTAFKKHATSKITSKEDLYNIATLGFRGEALAAISAVARTELITKTADSVAGTRLVLEAGQFSGDIISSEEIGCAEGSVFRISDLFYNVPARKKFLKSAQTEAGVINGLMQRLALSHPDISFRLTMNGKEALFTTGNGSLRDAIFSVYGRSATDNLVPVEAKTGEYKLTGFVGTPLYSKPNGNMQFTFVNGRVVRSLLLRRCLENAYRNSMLVGRFPVCFLFLETDAGAVDINVHPSKTEVKFADERGVSDFFLNAVKSALDSDNPLKHRTAGISEPVSVETERKPNTEVKPVIPKKNIPTAVKTENYGSWRISTPVNEPIKSEISDEKHNSVTKKYEPEHTENSFADNVAGVKYYTESEYPIPEKTPVEAESEFNAMLRMLTEKVNGADGTYGILQDDSVNVDRFTANAVIPSKMCAPATDGIPLISDEKMPEDFRIVGEVFDSFIIVERGEDVLFADKHALHERMNFEKLKTGEIGTQYLLAPVVVDLGSAENSVLREHLEDIRSAGFDIDDFGDSVIVRSIPQILSDTDIEDVLCRYAENFADTKLTKNGLLDEFLYDIACKASIKAGSKTSAFEAAGLIRMYFERENDLKYCPHGRPIVYALSKKSLEKQFKRIV